MPSKIFKVICFGALFFSITGAAACVWYVIYLDGIVTAKFHGPKWQFPSRIYSDAYLLIPGMNVRPQTLRQKLIRLGYRSSRQDPNVKGDYRFLKNGTVMEVYLHDFDYPAESFRGFSARIQLQGDTIANIENIESGEEIFALQLEPESVTGLYDRVWEQRKVVPLREVPPLLVRAILAVEDERFYRHRGIDPMAILRASWANLRSGRIVQGGSTLTQQLMKNFFLGQERTVGRKAKEVLMSAIAEWRYSKDEILENYLNEIYLGQNGAEGIFGVWEAARFYFSKEPKDLTPGEMALLAGLIKAPNRYSPYRSVNLATQRRNLVLGKMLEAGFITSTQYDAAMRELLHRRELSRTTKSAPYYVDFLKRELTERYSHKALTSEGLKIFTSLDLTLQEIAEKALLNGLKRLETNYPYLRRRGEQDRLEGAIVVIKPQTGEIKAMVGGRDYQKSQFNRVFQTKRQPGSTFKPFTYLAALLYGSTDGSEKFTPVTLLDDSPVTWRYEGQEWTPRNYKDEYFGTLTFRQALEKSDNTATVRIAKQVGIDKIRDTAYRLGIKSPLPSLPSLVLGAAEVTPLELAMAFSTLANNGVRTQPLVARTVVDQKGRVLERKDVRVERILTPQIAFMMNYLLEGVLDRGTGHGARLQRFDRPAAGKTGTTNDLKDSWFVGYTPDLLAVVWVGFDNQSKLGLSGAQAALPIWTEFMKQATAEAPVTDFVPPPGIKVIEIDPKTGCPAGPTISHAFQEAFLEGQVPNTSCGLQENSFDHITG